MITLPGSLICETGRRRGHYRYIDLDGHHYYLTAPSKAQAIQDITAMLDDTEQARQRYTEWETERIAAGLRPGIVLSAQEPIQIGLAEPPSGYTYPPLPHYHSGEK